MYNEAIIEFEGAASLMPSRRDQILENVERIQILMGEEKISG